MYGQDYNTNNQQSKVYIYYNTSDWEVIHTIQERFNLPTCTTVNGETCEPCTIKDEDWELLQETERRGFIQIRYKEK